MILIFLIGLFVRIIFINQHEFWFDEAFSWFIASQPLNTLLKATAIDTHPPFYYLVLKSWMYLSDNYLFMRLLSLIFGSFTLIIFYKIFKNKFATLLFALSPFHIYYSTEIRMYSFLVFLITAATHFFLTKRYILYSIFSILALYTHYYSALFILAINVYYLPLIKKDRIQFLKWLLLNFLILIAFIPWFNYALSNLGHKCFCYPTLKGIVATIITFGGGLTSIGFIKESIINQILPQLVIFIFPIALPFVFFLRGSLSSLRGKKWGLLILFFVPLTASIILSTFIPIFSPRSLIIILPFYYLIISYGIPDDNKITKSITVFLVSMLLLTQFIHPYFLSTPFKEASKTVREGSVFHLHPSSFYPFLHFNKEIPSYLTNSPGESFNKYVIANYLKDLEDAKSLDELWIANIPFWTNITKSEVVKTMENHKLESEVIYNSVKFSKSDDLEMYHFVKK